MKQRLFFLTVFVILTGNFFPVSGQIGREGRFPGGRDKVPGGVDGPFRPAGNTADTTNLKKKKERKLKVYPLKLYKYYYADQPEDSLHIDSLLLPGHHEQNNFVQRNLFDFIPFQNMGQPVNKLSPGHLKSRRLYNLIPEGKMSSYRDATEIPFFHVPTPYSRLYYLTGNNKGQMLDSRFGVNIRPEWYAGAGYRGINSLGYYQHSLTSQENWYVNTAYHLPGGKYEMRFLIVKNHLENEENGGITDETLFENPGNDYLDRGKIPVRLQDKSIWHSRQTKLFQSFKPVKDVPLSVVYDFDYTKAFFQYDGNNQAVYGDTVRYSRPNDSIGIRNYRHEFLLGFKKDSFSVSGGWAYHRLFIRFDTIVNGTQVYVPQNHLEIYRFFISKVKKKWKNIDQNLFLAYDWTGKQIIFETGLSFQNQYFSLESNLTYQNRLPDFQYRIWQSRFERFNWKKSFDREKKLEINTSIQTGAGKWEIDYRTYSGLTYFGRDSLPHQYDEIIGYLALKYSKNWRWTKFGLAPSIKWQKLNRPNPAMDVPEWNVNLMIYYTDYWFQNNMLMQAGVKLKHFSPFYLSGYNPLNNSFFQQRDKKYGDFSLIDLFFDFKVKKFKAFLTLEHFNALWERFRPRYYSAPYYPYADLVIRLGISWEFVN